MTDMTLKERAAWVVDTLKRTYPQAICTLTYQAPWQLLVASILSAQCTDARVNLITPDLFDRFPSLTDLAEAELSEIENLIRTCGLYRSKARAIQGSARMVLADHAGTIPDEREQLLALPGVGRKIANLMLGDAFGKPALVVDTHCARVSERIGLTDAKDPLRIEQDLVALVDEDDWIVYGHLMVAHGRALCPARRPACDRCPIAPHCRYARALEDAADRG